MGITTQEEWENAVNGYFPMEFDWFARDATGNLAVFSSFNQGPVPGPVFRSLERYLELKRFIDGLALSSAATVVTKQKGVFAAWINCAKKGLFAYDLQDVLRTQKEDKYDLIATPRVPLRSTRLPPPFWRPLPLL